MPLQRWRLRKSEHVFGQHRERVQSREGCAEREHHHRLRGTGVLRGCLCHPRRALFSEHAVHRGFNRGLQYVRAKLLRHDDNLVSGEECKFANAQGTLLGIGQKTMLGIHQVRYSGYGVTIDTQLG